MSQEKDVKESCRVNQHNLEQESLSWESDVEESGRVEEQKLEDKSFSGMFRWMSRSYRSEPAVELCSVTDSTVGNTSRKSEIDTYSDKNSSTGSEMSELAIDTLLVETRVRDLDREVYHGPDNDRYLIHSEIVFDNAADNLEMIAVSKRSMSLLPQKEAVRIDIQLFKHETEPLA